MLSGMLLTKRLGQKQVLVGDAVRWKVLKIWNTMHHVDYARLSSQKFVM